MSDVNLSVSDRALLIFAGFLAVLGATVIGLAVQGTVTETQLFDQYARPFTLAAAGLGTGHYLGRSTREKDSIHIHFATGFFLGIFIESIFFTFEQGVTIGEVGFLLPYPAVVIITALFAFIMQLSPAIPNDEDFTQVMNVFAGPVTTGFLILSSIVKFILSLELASGLIEIVGIGFVVIFMTAGWAYTRGRDSGKQIESEPDA